MNLEELIAQAEERAVDDTALARIASARDISLELAAVGDQVVDHFVEAARQEGCSWAQIGSVLGVTRQGAQQRFGGILRHVHRRAQRSLGGVARFGTDARRAVVEGQNVARAMGRVEVDTEHLLLGMLAAWPDALGSSGTDALGAAVLAELGVDRGSVEQELGTGAGLEPPPRSAVFFSSGTKKVLELSLREALVLGDARIGTEHIVLALLREGKGTASKILRSRGLSQQSVTAAILRARGPEPSA